MSAAQASNKKNRRIPAKARGAKRVVVDFPEPLYTQTEKCAAELDINRSSFIRLAVKKFVADLRRQRLERELAEAYTAMASVSQQVDDDFAHVDSEWP
jgi:metal-responsive CopG/Arc/MetJ family transcriptional regulator